MSRFGSRFNERFAAEIFGDALEEIVDWINEELVPEDVFSEDQLEGWDTDNGFVRASDAG